MQPAPEQPAPWYRSLPVIVLASILFPPLGLVLLWSRSGTDPQKKVMASVAIIALTAVYAFWFFSPYLFVRNPNAEAHYDELERHRAQQKQLPPVESGAGAPAPAAAPDGGAKAEPSTAAPASAAPASAARPGRGYWTDFRGPGRSGRYDEQKILTDWSSQAPALLWRQPVGAGYASFVIADGKAFTIEQRRRQEVVAAYDLATGREAWIQAWNSEFTEEQGDGPRATPVWDDGRIYALGAKGDLYCLDAKAGKTLWNRNILSENGAENLPWGMAGSPLVVDDKVIVHPGGSGGKSVVAYNKLTGQPLWRTLDDRAAYSSPMLVTLAGKRQILLVTSRRAVGLNVEDGSLLWEYPWTTQMGINCSQPIVVGDNRFFISAGYGKGAALVEVSGSGKALAARTVWENINMKNKFNSSVLHEGYIYGLDEGILTCISVDNGERKWKGGRYGYGQVVLASGHLIVLTDAGDLVLVRATPEKHDELSRVPALEGRTWNYPAIAEGRLLVRNATQMACYNLAGQ